MRVRIRFLLVLCLLPCGGCGKKSTDELIADLKSPQEKDRIIAVRLLPQRKGDATPQIVPAMIESLKDKEGDVRWSAAIGLGYFGEEAKDAIPALQAALHDRDARVREAAGVALSRIDPTKFSPPSKRRGK
jgi:HEAT repeat protein